MSLDTMAATGAWDAGPAGGKPGLETSGGRSALMGMIPISEAAVTAGLRCFLAKFTVLRPASSIAVHHASLFHFLDKAHPLLHRSQTDLPIITRLETNAGKPVLPGAMPASEVAVAAGLRRFLAGFAAQRPASPQGCSTLSAEEQLEQGIEAAKRGGVALLAERRSAVALQDVVSE